MVAATRFHAKEVAHQFYQSILWQQLIVQQIEHERRDPLAVLRRRIDAFGKGRPRPRAAGRALAVVGAMFGDDGRLRLGHCIKIEGDLSSVLSCFAARTSACRIALLVTQGEV